MLPTFIIAGAPKSGTTTLWATLQDHPQVQMAALKEPGFFTDVTGCGNNPDGRSPRLSGSYSKGLEWYKSLFKVNPRARAVGEASSVYISEPDSPGLIKRYLPEVNLIFILRDPVERVYSHYWHERRVGWCLPAFETMLRQQNPAFERYVLVSSYHLHLQRYFNYFSQEQVIVLLYDDLVRNPKQLFERVCLLIGVDPEYLASSPLRKYNQAWLPKNVLIQRYLEMMSRNRWLIASHPSLFNLLGKLGNVFVKLNTDSANPSKISPELRMEMVAKFDQTIDYVESILDRDLPSWRTAEAQ